MADATASFAVVLEDQTSGAAASASSSLQTMRGAVDSASERVKALQTAMRNLKGPGAENTEQWKALNAELTAAKAELQSSTSKFLSAGGSFERSSEGLSMFNEKTGLLNEQVKKAIGPLGEKADRVMALKNVLGSGGLAAAGFAAAVVVLAVVVIAAAVAIGKLIYEMAEYALVTASAAMKQRTIWEALTGSASAAGEVGAAVAKISREVPISAAEVAKLANELAKSGKRGKELEDALFKASMKAAGYGDKVKRGSDVARKAMLPIDVQLAKLKDNFAAIFAGVKVESFLESMADVLDVFDESTASGKALRAIVSEMLDPLFDAVARSGPAVKMFLKGLVIGALMIAIAVKRAGKAISEAFGESSLLDGIDTLKVAMYAGIVGAFVLAAAFVVLALAAGVLAVILAVVAAVVIGSLLVALLIVALPFVILAAVIAGFILMVLNIYDAIAAAIGWLGELGAAGISAAGDLISGLVNGITSGAGAVYDAIESMASGMVSKLKGALGISSPSKLFAGLGAFTAEGFAVGVDAEAPAVADSVASMVEPPAVGELAAAGAVAARGAGAGGAVAITIPFTYTGADKAQESEARGMLAGLCETLEIALEQAGIPATVAVT